MKLVVGAPVAERAWALPRWFECLGEQTVRPDQFCFVYSQSKDQTLSILQDGRHSVNVISAVRPYFPRSVRNADAADPHRAEHMASLRNTLRGMFLQTDGDVFLSLDTDILLEEPTVLEQLLETLQEGKSPEGLGWDAVQPLLYLHATGAKSYCYNAGFWHGGELGDFGQGWRRADVDEVLAYRSPLQIDVPMAAVMMKRHTLGMCKYAAHECGEDIGFAQSLAKHRMQVAWRTDLEVRHVWGPEYLDAKAPAGSDVDVSV